MTPPRARWDINDQRDRDESAEPIDQNEPADRTEANDATLPIDSADPTLPIDSADPTLPIDRTDPFEAMLSSEPSLHSDQRDAIPTIMPTVPGMAIIGTHALLYTSEPDALRAVLRDVFGWHHVDAHDGWLIFRLPPAELGVHPADAPAHEISFMCDDLTATVAELSAKGVQFDGAPEVQGFGTVITMVLPGGVRALLYEPRHPVAI
jgi:hypothetical protein